jgi:hypothetical protein
MTDLTKFETKEELFDFLKTNKRFLIAEKKSAIKHADSISGFIGLVKSDKVLSTKSYNSEQDDTNDVGILQVKLAINATRIMDSHSDVHIDGLWDKSIKENKYPLHLQEHITDFKHLISDNVTATTEKIDWKTLGFDYSGKSQVLVFISKISKDDNEYMYNRYFNGKVKQHSVGMRYMNLFMCINSEESRYSEEKASWDKYFPMVANSEKALEQGYFWAVTEAKFIEGSAVLLGSNQATPTLETTQVQPSDDTENEDNKTAVNIDTVKRLLKQNFNQLIN